MNENISSNDSYQTTWHLLKGWHIFKSSIVNTEMSLFITALLSMTYRNFNLCKTVWEGYLPCLLISVIPHRSLHWLPVQYRIMFKICIIAYQARIYIHCSFLQESLYSFDHIMVIYFLFPMLRQMSELELMHRRFGTNPMLVLSMYEI